jgi:pimeloyl-ACP methyl ester carboxylesterase
MNVFQDGNQTLYFSIKGSGKPIVFLHGFLEDSSMWNHVEESFKDDYQTILIDLPCHGKSRFNGESCSMQFMAQIVSKFLKAKGLNNVTIVGHSMGGYVGLELLKLIDGDLILLHSNFWEDPKEKKLDRNRVIGIVKKNKNLFIQESIPNLFAAQNVTPCKEHIKDLISRAKEIPSEEIMAATRGLRDRKSNYNIMESGKVSIIQGKLDPIIPSAQLDDQIKLVESVVNVIEIEDCGHMSIWESFDSLIDAIKITLKSRN